MSQHSIVFLPGLDGTGALLREFVKRAPSRYQATAVSYPGDRILDYDELADRVRGELPVGGRVLLVAESFSGPIAVMVAASGAASVCGVVLVGSFVTSPVNRLARLVPWRLVFSLRPPAWALRHFVAGRGAPDDLIAEIRSALTQVTPAVLASRVRSVLGVDVRSQLARCRVPLLYLRATDDRLVPRECANIVAGVAHDATVRDVLSPHLMIPAAPDAVWKEIDAFRLSLETL